MGLTFAAIGAVIAALLDLTIAPYLRIDGAQPDFVLVCAVVWTVVAGIEGGLIWAFIGGLMIDFLAPRPLGLTAFTLLVCVGGAAVLDRMLTRTRFLTPIVAVLVFSIVNPLLFLAIDGAIRGPIQVSDVLTPLLPAALYDTLLAALLGFVGFKMIARRQNRERLDW